MATINFPSSPALNQAYTFEGRSWIWNGKGWEAIHSEVAGGQLGTTFSIDAGAVFDEQINAAAAISDTKLDTISTAGKVSNSATTATSANTAEAIVSRDANGDFAAGTITADLAGNADTATTLETARTIGGVSFNGSANINLPGVNTAGNQDTSGNAATASKLNSARTFALTGDVTGTVSSDLTSGASIAASIAAGAIVDADVSGSAAIAGSKIDPDFGGQDIKTTGSVLVAEDGTGRLLVGTDQPTSSAIVEIKGPSTFSNTLDKGFLYDSPGTKTYPTTASYSAYPGFNQNVELGTAQVVDTVTPGGYNFVIAFNNKLTKSAGNTQDIERLYFNGFSQYFTWTDANTCKQYVSFEDHFTYSGINANGRTSSSLNSRTIRLQPPDGGAQTINYCSSTVGLTCFPQGSSTINVNNSFNISPNLGLWNFSAGTKTINITSHAFFSTSPFWGAQGTTGTLNATIANLYGLRLTTPQNPANFTVTNNWGIRQEWSSAKNWFAGVSKQFPNITTTASGANAFLDSGDSNRLYRSSSSLVYKRDIEDLDSSYADNIHLLRPVWYRSKCEADCPDWSWFGLIAEEVAQVEPRLVHFGYQEDAYETVEIEENVELPLDDPRRNDGIETELITKAEQRLRPDAKKVANGIAYDRLTVLLLDVVQRQEQRIQELESRLNSMTAS